MSMNRCGSKACTVICSKPPITGAGCRRQHLACQYQQCTLVLRWGEDQCTAAPDNCAGKVMKYVDSKCQRADAGTGDYDQCTSNDECLFAPRPCSGPVRIGRSSPILRGVLEREDDLLARATSIRPGPPKEAVDVTRKRLQSEQRCPISGIRCDSFHRSTHEAS
jgi:hypothetical protein